MPSPKKAQTDRTTTVVVPLVVALIGAAAILVPPLLQKPEPPPRPEGSITSPVPGQRVARALAVEGALAGVPEQHHVWLAVQVGNSLWPKQPEVRRRDQRWRREIVEAGLPRDGKFSVVLLMVGPQGQAQIEEWTRHGQATGNWPGLTELADAEQLAVVGDLEVESR